jgi:hypothetical protein
MVDWTDGPSTGGLFSFPSGMVTTRLARSRRNDTGFLTTAESRERRGPADGTGRSRLDAEAASWRPPRAQAGSHDCGSDGDSTDRSPRSPRIRDDDGRSRNHPEDSVRTIATPSGSWARTPASSAPVPSSPERGFARSQSLAWFGLVRGTPRLGAGSTVPFPISS